MAGGVLAFNNESNSIGTLMMWRKGTFGISVRLLMTSETRRESIAWFAVIVFFLSWIGGPWAFAMARGLYSTHHQSLTRS
jgi:hypothetical protein